ncbi:MAG: 3'-5' exonuclease, partial [Patescibacteria group bacterium]
VVGDDDQAIYRFRGASISNILEFKNDYPKGEQVVLTANYRSRQEILDAAHAFIRHNNPHRLECRLQDAPTIVSQAKKRGMMMSKFKAIDKQLRAQAGTGATIEHLHFANVSREVDGVIQKIIDLKRADKKLAWSDFAILVRANAHARPFIAALTRLRLPFYFVALRGLYSKESILDVLAYFRLLDNYHESAALWRVLNFPTINLTDADRIALTHHAKYRGCSLYEAMTRAAAEGIVGSEASKQIAALVSQITRHTRLAQEKTISELFVTAFTDLGYFQYLKDHEETGGRQELDYLRQWYRKIREFEEATDDAHLKAFMARINLEIESGEEGGLQFDLEAGPETIRLMTIHAAKGLEFSHVFIVNVVQQRFPTAERAEAIALPDELIKEVVPAGDIHLQEERRLMYVAMTRAKTGLYFTSAADYGGTRAKKLSRFLDELGYQVAEEQSAAIKDVIDRPTIAAPIDRAAVVVPKKFTYSQLSSYNKCPLQYKYAYVLKIPTFGKPSFSFGNTIHGTLQKFFELLLEPNSEKTQQQANLFARAPTKKSSFPPLATLLKIYDDKWIDAWYDHPEQKQEYYQKGRGLLAEYHRVLARDRPHPIALEQPFTIKVSGASVGGRIDRIDAVPGGVAIVDYKTGQAKEVIKDDDKDQLLIYQLAAEETLGFKPQQLTYYYIEDGKAMSFLGTEQDKEKIKAKITATIGKIKTGDFTPTAGWVCRYCDFKDICSFRDPAA